MKTPLFFSLKQNLGTRLFVLIVLVSIIIPQTYTLSIPLAFADDETQNTESSNTGANVERETESSTDEAANNSRVNNATDNIEKNVIDTNSSVGSIDHSSIEIVNISNNESINDISTIPVTSVNVNPTLDTNNSSEDNANNSGNTTHNTSTNNNDSSHETEDIQPEVAGANSLTTTPQTGSITVCNVIAKADGQIVSSPAGLPNAAFSLNLRTRIGTGTPIQTSPSIQEFDFYSHLFTQTTPSPIPVSAQCIKYKNFELRQYIYSPVTVTSEISNRWETPKYNDQFITSVNSVNSFYPYSQEMFDNNQANDGQRNEDADGIITLTANRPNRVLVILNKLKPVTPQTGSITVCNMIITKNGQIATSTAGLPAGQFNINFYPLSSPQTPVQNSAFNTATFNPAIPSVSGLAAECKKYEHLPLQAYVYTQETITGASDETWQTPKYNDGYILPPNQLNNYFLYSPESFDNDPSNDALKNEDSDGIITLNVNRPDRVLVVMNKHNLVGGEPPPACANGMQLSVTEFGTAVSQGRITYSPIVVDAGTTTATFTMHNNTGCTAPITLTSYKMFDPLPVLSTQVLFDRAGVIQATSTTILKVRIPNCAAQIDAWFGMAPEFLVDSNPYSYPSVPHVLNALLVRQDQSCNTNPVNTPPTITLIGSNPLSITKGSTFTDPGATALDAQDGNLTASIVATGTVDTNVVGTYTRTYTVTDSGGLSASTTRTINVTSGGPTNNPPTITVLGDNPMIVYIHTTFTDPGATATDPEDGNLTSQIVTTGSVDTNTLGSYTITYTVTDSKGVSVSANRTVNIIENTDDNGGGGGGGGSRRKSSGGRVLGVETGPTACFYLNDYLRRDLNNDQGEVLKLQLFLKYFENEGNLIATGNFDQATFDAVSRFQTKYSSDILSPWGYNAPTGYVYILTKKKVNEIFCKTAFPINAQQQEEINNFKSLIQGLHDRGLTVPTDGTMMIDDHVIDVKDTVGLATSTNPENPNSEMVVKDKMIKDKMNTEHLKAVAAAIFSIPKDRETILQGIYFLLIALIAIYLFTEIIVGSQDLSKLTKYRIRSRKATGYFAGLIVAMIAAIWYQAFSIIVPLLVLAIISGIFLAWTMTKKSDDDIINLPPSSNR